jgi:hypothetical protein
VTAPTKTDEARATAEVAAKAETKAMAKRLAAEAARVAQQTAAVAHAPDELFVKAAAEVAEAAEAVEAVVEAAQAAGEEADVAEVQAVGGECGSREREWTHTGGGKAHASSKHPRNDQVMPCQLNTKPCYARQCYGRLGVL